MNKKLKLEELNRQSIEDYKNSKKMPVIVVLDNIRSLHNIGSIFRTCDALAVEAIYLCGITATPPQREINKTALGATESVSWKYFETTVDAVKELKKEKFTIISVEQTDKSKSLKTIKISPSKKYAIILGNEVEGVDQEAVNFSDECVELEQYGTKHSFNVSVCAGIVLWEMQKYFFD